MDKRGTIFVEEETKKKVIEREADKIKLEREIRGETNLMDSFCEASHCSHRGTGPCTGCLVY